MRLANKLDKKEILKEEAEKEIHARIDRRRKLNAKMGLRHQLHSEMNADIGVTGTGIYDASTGLPGWAAEHMRGYELPKVSGIRDWNKHTSELATNFHQFSQRHVVEFQAVESALEKSKSKSAREQRATSKLDAPTTAPAPRINHLYWPFACILAPADAEDIPRCRPDLVNIWRLQCFVWSTMYLS